jgi:hypothetical protein
MIAFSRISTLLMAGVVCFGLLVPIALRRHAVALAIAVSAVYLIYLAANVVLWRRVRRRA